MDFLKTAKGKLGKNAEVLREQWGDWVDERDAIVRPGIVNAWRVFKHNRDASSFLEVTHKCHAFTEEIIDKNPRLFSYLAYPRRIAEIALVLYFIGT